MKSLQKKAKPALPQAREIWLTEMNSHGNEFMKTFSVIPRWRDIP